MKESKHKYLKYLKYLDDLLFFEMYKLISYNL